MVTASSILMASIKEAKELAKQSGVDEKPMIATRADAQDEADRRNYAIQATIGAKEGVAEAITNKVGSDITDSVLRNVDGNDNKGVDEYNLYEVIQATIQGAIRPTMTEILTQKIAVINYTFDFRKKVATNMEVLRAKANRVISFGISHDDTEIALTLLANVDKATHHDWGLEFRPAMQEVRKNYNYNYTHDAASLANMLKEFAAADAIRTLSNAPEPTNEAAHLVQDTVNMFQDLMQAESDYESAYAVHSDSDSSNSARTRKKRDKSKDRGRGRSRSKSTPQGINKDCPGCKEFKRRRRHPNVPNEKCFWNKKYKGFRPKWICDEMELTYKGRLKFPAEMGGYRSDSEDEWRCGGPEEEQWIRVTWKKTSTINTKAESTNFVNYFNSYNALAASKNLDPPDNDDKTQAPPVKTNTRKARKRYIRHILRQLDQQESAFLERSIIRAENERTELAKKDPHNKYRRAVEHNHKKQQTPLTWMQRSRNTAQSIQGWVRVGVERDMVIAIGIGRIGLTQLLIR